MRKGTFYLGRIVKFGTLTTETLIKALSEALIIDSSSYSWAFTDVTEFRENDLRFIYGKLSKFAKDGEISVINRQTRKEERDSVTDLATASSPFVYLPDYSGIAYLHVWNQIQEKVFRSRFEEIIERTVNELFAKCEIEPISDYRTFATRIKELDIITEISAQVNPPNPLFGRLWKSLKEYIISRNADTINISETTDRRDGLKTNIKNVFETVARTDSVNGIDEVLSLSDSAVLMAADGYGKGKIVGKENGKEKIIRTGDSQKSFQFEKEPHPFQLAQETELHLKDISSERKMGH